MINARKVGHLLYTIQTKYQKISLIIIKYTSTWISYSIIHYICWHNVTFTLESLSHNLSVNYLYNFGYENIYLSHYTRIGTGWNHPKTSGKTRITAYNSGRSAGKKSFEISSSWDLNCPFKKTQRTLHTSVQCRYFLLILQSETSGKTLHCSLPGHCMPYKRLQSIAWGSGTAARIPVWWKQRWKRIYNSGQRIYHPNSCLLWPVCTITCDFGRWNYSQQCELTETQQNSERHLQTSLKQCPLAAKFPVHISIILLHLHL